MNVPGRILLASLAFPALLAAPLSAQDTHTNGVVISDSDPAVADLFVQDFSVLDGQVCIGNGCADNVLPHQNTGLQLKSATTTIDFTDTSGNPGFPTRDWQLRVNDPGNGGLDRFSVRDLDEDTIPFTIEGGAPDNALYVNSAGDVGLGTIFPETELHIVGGYPVIKLEHSTNVFPSYNIGYSGTGDFYIRQEGDGLFASRLIINKATTSSGLDPVWINAEGNVGLGTATPTAPLHIQKNDATAQIRVEEFESPAGPRTLLNLQNNGRPEIVMGNSSTGGEWSFGAGSNFILKQGSVGSASSTKTKLFEIQPTGDAVLTGSLTTGGTTCGGGCDRVFSQDYDLPSIAEHTDQMFSLGHLPNVGPTPEGAPFNLTDKLGRMLNELEHAHIYIAQQQDELETQRAQNRRQGDLIESQHRMMTAMNTDIATLTARLAALEAQLAD
ncbi:hypothetical protein [Marimonas arenosa]|uniref:Uncharacterized protein n=1 Tax=Marimonas arenosa TaxID=1795305 RepID=A0AAE3WGA1_9RHOB|nr:hypothetical protein [Marimonas arenosa]MDQ2092139.1 hypothetical protein [Marimonas arenosa]